jgi:hypothetical protein
VGLDLDALAKSVVGIGMELAGTGKKTAIVHFGKNKTYDAESDSLSASGGQDISLQGILYKDKQRQGTASDSTTSDFLINGADLPSKIDEADNVTIDGEDWNIADVDDVQNGAAYILRLRK